jgi:hypothetical protein
LRILTPSTPYLRVLYLLTVLCVWPSLAFSSALPQALLEDFGMMEWHSKAPPNTFDQPPLGLLTAPTVKSLVLDQAGWRYVSLQMQILTEVLQPLLDEDAQRKEKD